MAQTFTARRVAALAVPSVTTKQVDYWDAGLPGLGLRVSFGGTRTWIVRYRANGQRRRLKLGTFPAMTLADARTAAQHALHAVQVLQQDPAAEKKADREADTIAGLCRIYMERRSKPHKRSWREDQRIINREILPFWKSLKVRDLTKRQIRERVEAIVDRGAPAQANAVLMVITAILSYAVSIDMVDANPAREIPKPSPRQSRDRVLTNAEIRELWTALSEAPSRAPRRADGLFALRLAPAVSAGMKLRLLTCQRGGEIFAMKWADVDLTSAVWTIPANVAKNGIATRVPLTSSALAILDDRRAESAPDSVYVFEMRDAHEQVIPMTTPGRKAANVLVMGRHPRRVTKRKRRVGPGVSFHFRGHDLRRTGATLMAAGGVSHEIIARVLNHTQGGPQATATYNRWTFDVEKRQALERLETRLNDILSAPDTADVVPFAQAVR